VGRGHADGLQPRTLEVLKSLGVADRILNCGRHLWEFALWECTGKRSIKRSFVAPTMTEEARYQQVIMISPGVRGERVRGEPFTVRLERGAERLRVDSCTNC
jgi:2-polyprenyl-6-methoxyphenol hydroxylase-like FAD-dependent oxidoreductase